MYSNPQRQSDKLTKKLRQDAGRWLCELREKQGLSQRDLARMVGAEYYTFISQLECGRGRIPPDRYLIWARALRVEAREFVKRLMCYYDPVTFGIIFGRQIRARAGDDSKSSVERAAWASVRGKTRALATR
jgi:transcriptional regulator with XRE-family HTH domain